MFINQQAEHNTTKCFKYVDDRRDVKRYFGKFLMFETI
jgi:hypothetical protein